MKGIDIRLIGLFVAVLLVSGCVGFGGDAGISGNGVVITKFEPSLTSIESNDDLILHLEVQNRGEAIAKSAARLLGIYTQEWRVFQTDEQIGELLPADTVAGTEGQLGTINWKLTAPALERGDARTYEPLVRVYYSYETKVTKPMTFVTSEELRRVVQTGDSLQSGVTRTSAGPMSVTVKTGNFLRTKEGWDQSYFPIEIAISNTGGGLIAGENYPIGIEITAPPGTMFRGDCPRSSQTEFGTLYSSDIPSGIIPPISPDTIFLWDGKGTKITCELKVLTPPTAREERDLKVTLKYVYYSDKKTQIAVRGTEEWGF